MGASSDEGGASTASQSREYRFVSATYRDRTHSNGILLVDEARSEMELRQWAGRRKKEQAAIVRFRIEPTAKVLVDGPLLIVSELSITLESPAKATELAGILQRPAKEQEAVQGLSEAESALAELLVSREQAVTFLSQMKVDPREAMLGAESLWAAGDNSEPLDAVYSSYSARLAGSLEKMTSCLASAQKKVGPVVTERIYALAYALGTVQNALLEGDFNQDQELAALQEMGITATSQDLRAEKLTERLLQRAHPVLVGLAMAQAQQS
jgi:hypothetical protein